MLLLLLTKVKKILILRKKCKFKAGMRETFCPELSFAVHDGISCNRGNLHQLMSKRSSWFTNCLKNATILPQSEQSSSLVSFHNKREHEDSHAEMIDMSVISFKRVDWIDKCALKRGIEHTWECTSAPNTIRQVKRFEIESVNTQVRLKCNWNGTRSYTNDLKYTWNAPQVHLKCLVWTHLLWIT